MGVDKLNSRTQSNYNQFDDMCTASTQFTKSSRFVFLRRHSHGGIACCCCQGPRFDSLASISAADYSKLDLQIHFEQLPQHGTISYGLQATPSGRQNWDAALAPKIDGVKKAPAVINNAATSFNNEVFFIFFSPYKNKVEPE